MENSFEDFKKQTFFIIRKMQNRPFAAYRKNKWKCTSKKGKWMEIYKDGLTPYQAANLWGLSHQIIKT
jgi:hypothetical protein